MSVVEFDSDNAVAHCDVEAYIGGFVSNEAFGYGMKMYADGKVRSCFQNNV